MLEVCGLTKRFNGIPAVEDVSFTLRPGEILGYVGPNGAGKSTTVKMIIGLLEPSEGQVRFQGRSVLDDLTGFQARIGYVPEEPHLYPHLSGREYLELVGRLRGLPRPILESKIDEFLRLFSLWDDRHCFVSAYSKGMRQKILLSAALLHNPDLLILDEPLSGLDVTTALVLRELVEGLAARGRMILYSSHVLDVLEKVCSRVLILCKGRVAAHDSIEHLRETMHESSLEGIFGQLTREQNHRSVANHILEVMQA
jgi:ABC-2 type transport system ATP-binding protein